jgi:ABC-type Fe3+/spermidine/putrescine transport system ATPase subunit
MTAKCGPIENGNGKASLEIRNIIKQFGDLVAVNDVSLDIKEGEIYESSRTTFVADFMGASNIFPGRAETRKDGRIEFRNEEGLQLTLPDSADTDIDKIEGVSVHPEVIGVAQDESELKTLGTEEYTFFHGQVKDIFYQGDFSELTVALKNARRDLSIHKARGITQDKELCAGQDVIVYWSWENSNILISE